MRKHRKEEEERTASIRKERQGKHKEEKGGDGKSGQGKLMKTSIATEREKGALVRERERRNARLCTETLYWQRMQGSNCNARVVK